LEDALAQAAAKQGRTLTPDAKPCYHQPCDAWSERWDLRGAAQDVQMLHELGRELASSDRWPQWKPGSEFKDVRERSAAARQKAAPPKAPEGASTPGK